jgi:hypothetical protein
LTTFTLAKVGGAGRRRGQYVLVSIIWGHNMWPLYGVEGWPPTRGFLSTILYGDAIRTKVSGRYRQGGRSSGVAVKRGSTVGLAGHLVMYNIINFINNIVLFYR